MRIRTIRPDFWEDEKIGDLSRDARLLYIATWNIADDEGRLRWAPALLRNTAFAYDDLPIAEVRDLMAELTGARRVLAYEVEGETYAVIPKFREHQRINRPSPSRLPEPPGNLTDTSVKPHGALTEDDKTAGQTSISEGSVKAHGAVSESSPPEGEGEGEGEREGSGARKRGTRLPDIFPITEEMSAWGRENAPDVNATREHEKFCDYWRGVSGQRGVKRDWTATWRNWMRRAQDDVNPNRGSGDDDLPEWMRA